MFSVRYFFFQALFFQFANGAGALLILREISESKLEFIWRWLNRKCGRRFWFQGLGWHPGHSCSHWFSWGWFSDAKVFTLAAKFVDGPLRCCLGMCCQGSIISKEHGHHAQVQFWLWSWRGGEPPWRANHRWGYLTGYTQSVEESKTWDKRRRGRFQRVSGLRHSPVSLRSSYTVPMMRSVGDNHWLMSVEEHPIFSRSWNRPFLITRSIALVGSIKARWSGLPCSRDFSCSWHTVTIMSVVDLPARKQHGDLGYTRSAVACSLIRSTRATTLPAIRMREMPRYIHDSCYSLFRLSGRLCSYRAWWWCVTHVLYDGAFIPSCGINFIRGIAAGKLDSFWLDFVSVSDKRGSVIYQYL